MKADVSKKEARYKLKTDYFDYLKNTAQEVDPYVQNFLEHHFSRHAGLREQLLKRYRFGKPQLRPGIVRLSFEVVGGKNWKKIIPACAAVEVRDTSYYCIDDILDQAAPLRLVLPALAFHAASHAMILDLGNCIPQSQFAKIQHEIVRLDEDTVQAGAFDEEMRGTDEQYYWKKVEGYNFWDEALKIGAILGGGTDKQIALLGRIGNTIGKAHIVANDTWDVAKKCEDVRQGKYTLPIIFALTHATNDNKAKLKNFLGKKNLSDNETDTVRKIMVRCGAIEHGKLVARELCDKAMTLLSQLPESNARKLLEFSTTYTQKSKFYDVLNAYA